MPKNGNISAIVPIGSLDRKITIRQYVETQSGTGAVALAWSDLAEVWAAVNYGSGTEKFNADQERAFQGVTFIIRYNGSLSIDKKMRILYEGNEYDITAIVEMGRRKFWQIAAELRE